MSKAKGNALRYSTPGDMPAGMRALHDRQHGYRPVQTQPAKRASKYGAVPTVVDGIRFDSKREAGHYTKLKGRQAAGDVLFFLRQVPLHLPGGTKLVVDFVVFEADGRVRFQDAKGHETATFKVKRREVEHHYPVEIELV